MPSHDHTVTFHHYFKVLPILLPTGDMTEDFQMEQDKERVCPYQWPEGSVAQESYPQSEDQRINQRVRCPATLPQQYLPDGPVTELVSIIHRRITM